MSSPHLALRSIDISLFGQSVELQRVADRVPANAAPSLVRALAYLDYARAELVTTMQRSVVVIDHRPAQPAQASATR